MSVHYHDPRAVLATPSDPYGLKADFTRAMTIGLLANGFPDSEEFLDAVEAALAPALPAAQFRRYNKHGASVPASDKMLGTIASECQVIATAYGH